METPKQSYTEEQIRAYRTPKKRKRKKTAVEKRTDASKTSSSPRSSKSNDPGRRRKTSSGRAPSQKERPAGSGRQTERPAGSGRQTERPAGSGSKRTSVYTPRQPAKWQRSERVPFGEAEGFDTYRKSLSSGKTDVPSRSANGDKLPLDSDELLLSNKRKKNRSDKAPSKRQLRKNRERARKRDMKKRKKERKQEGR